MTHTRPDFLCIGAQKAATTWLYQALRGHPQIWLPPVKELQHFNSITADGRPTVYRQRTRVWQLNRAGRRALKGTKGQAIDAAPLRWIANYALAEHCGDDWYAGLFSGAAGRCCGDITPAYATLTAEQVRRIRATWPALKIIFIMREPVERALSGMKERLGNKKKRIRKLGDAEMIEILDSDHNASRTDYRRTIEIWETHFPRQQIQYLFYDQVRTDPDIFLGAVLDFLGVAGDDAARLSRLTDRANPSPEVIIGRTVRRHLALKYRELTCWLRDRFGGVTEQWVTNLNQALDA